MKATYFYSSPICLYVATFRRHYPPTTIKKTTNKTFGEGKKPDEL